MRSAPSGDYRDCSFAGCYACAAKQATPTARALKSSWQVHGVLRNRWACQRINFLIVEILYLLDKVHVS